MDAQQAEHDVAMILSEIDQLEDARQGCAVIQERIADLEAAGVLVPENLARVHKVLQAECMAQSQGR